ncbi:MAG: UDP-3-O-(3-hydroxymyristoyl)glucosamine N-acyltransferase [Elusimicrobiales bacterium]
MRLSVDEISRRFFLRYLGDGKRIISRVSAPEKADENSAFFVEDPLKLKISDIKGGCVFVSQKNSSFFDTSKFSVIITENPKMDFAKLLGLFEKENQKDYSPFISPLSVISKKAVISKGVYIGNFVTIEDDVIIEDGAIIEDGCYVGKNSFIGKNTRLYPRVSLRENVRIGANCIIHSGAVIGSDGFGYVGSQNGYVKIPQVGGVIIEDDVEIGANTTIDRATLDQTFIGSGTKIDNLVHIAHNVKIGRNCLILACAAIAGSTVIEDNCIIGGQAGLTDHIKIGRGAIVMSKSGVIGNVEEGKIVFGYPAREREEFMRIAAAMSKLPQMYKEYIKNKK